MNPSENLSIATPNDIESLHICLLSEQLDTLYQSTREERSAIALWEEEQEFSLLGVIELFSAEIQGYAEQVKLGQFVEPFMHSVNHLRQLNVFSINYFAEWYFVNWKRYPQTKQYIDQLDHLRLVILESFNQRASVAA